MSGIGRIDVKARRHVAAQHRGRDQRRKGLCQRKTGRGERPVALIQQRLRKDQYARIGTAVVDQDQHVAHIPRRGGGPDGGRRDAGHQNVSDRSAAGQAKARGDQHRRAVAARGRIKGENPQRRVEAEWQIRRHGEQIAAGIRRQSVRLLGARSQLRKGIDRVRGLVAGGARTRVPNDLIFRLIRNEQIEGAGHGVRDPRDGRKLAMGRTVRIEHLRARQGGAGRRRCLRRDREIVYGAAVGVRGGHAELLHGDLLRVGRCACKQCQSAKEIVSHVKQAHRETPHFFRSLRSRCLDDVADASRLTPSISCS